MIFFTVIIIHYFKCTDNTFKINAKRQRFERILTINIFCFLFFLKQVPFFPLDLALLLLTSGGGMK